MGTSDTILGKDEMGVEERAAGAADEDCTLAND
jgi:hypothetical protein